MVDNKSLLSRSCWGKNLKHRAARDFCQKPGGSRKERSGHWQELRAIGVFDDKWGDRALTKSCRQLPVNLRVYLPNRAFLVHTGWASPDFWARLQAMN
ncbi:hypothetical protein [Microcoleus sp. bin38.metabat.b11b12b14.051]|uniref:hypothetical protein n=1 Tax=Microcoleus sp. bin38.metabat.b11b12b14.051 TaxID=2742709 RepID=UPI0025D70BD9|nr:hypothetical protein [Microcoleus sp. bin38.metabat.b11b12b14.051]